MPTPSRHYKDELQDWLDGRLDAASCDEVEQHLETCAECRREYEAMAWTKQRTTGRLAPAEVPPELREKILQSLRAPQPITDLETARRSFWRAHPRPLLAAAAIVLLAALLAAVSFLKPVALPELVARDYWAYRARTLALELSAGEVKAMESFFSRRGISFNTRVFDLGMMKYQLVGGRIVPAGARPRALFVYRGPAGQELVCQMYEGKVGELPGGCTVRENRGIQLQVYQRDGLTAVFWQEGAVVCVLVSDIPTEEVVQLAFAKAMP